MKVLKELKPQFSPKYHENLRDLITWIGAEYKDDLAFIIKHKAPRGQEPTYERISFQQFGEDVKNLGAALFERDLLTHRVAIISKNRYEWMVSYFAAACGNAMVVPLDRGLPYEEFESCMVRSRADVLIYGDDVKDLVETLKKSGKGSCETYICMDEMEGELSLPMLMEEGKAAPEEDKETYWTTPIDAEAVKILLSA